MPATIALTEAWRDDLEFAATRGPDQGSRRLPVAVYDDR